MVSLTLKQWRDKMESRIVTLEQVIEDAIKNNWYMSVEAATAEMTQAWQRLFGDKQEGELFLRFKDTDHYHGSIKPEGFYAAYLALPLH